MDRKLQVENERTEGWFIDRGIRNIGEQFSNGWDSRIAGRELNFASAIINVGWQNFALRAPKV